MVNGDMTNKRFKYKLTDGFFDGDRLISIKEVVELLNQLHQENQQLKEQLKEMQQDEKLYAQEIVKLNKEAKEVLNFKTLGGDY